MTAQSGSGQTVGKEGDRKGGASVLCAGVPALSLDLLHQEGVELGARRDSRSGSGRRCGTAERPHAVVKCFTIGQAEGLL